MPYQMPQMNMADAFAMAREMRQMEARRAQDRRARQQAQQQQHFMQLVQGGDTAGAATAYPGMWIQHQKQQFEVQKQQQEAEKLRLANQEAQNTAYQREEQIVAGFAPRIQKAWATGDTNTLQSLLDAMRRFGVSDDRMGALEQRLASTPGFSAQVGDVAAANLQALSPQEAEELALTKDGQELAISMGHRTKVSALRDPSFLEELNKMAKQPRGTTITNQFSPTSDATKASQNKQQGKLDAVVNMRNLIKNVRSAARQPDGTHDYSGFVGKGADIKVGVAGARSTLGDITEALFDKRLGDMTPHEREAVRNVELVRGMIAEFKTERFRELIGATQTATEIKNLAGAIPSLDMNSNRFAAAIELLDVRAEQIERHANEVLSQGYRVGTKEFQQLVSDRVQAEAGRGGGGAGDAELDALIRERLQGAQ